MQRRPSTVGRASILIAAALDLALVLLFVLIGRRSHDEEATSVGILRTLWPFATGLAVGWLLARAWRRPFGVRPTGLTVWLSTVVIGMLLRVASRQGVQVSFIVVATIVLAVFLLGWRAVAALLARRGANAVGQAGR